MASHKVETVMVVNPAPVTGNVWLGNNLTSDIGPSFTGVADIIQLHGNPAYNPATFLANTGFPPLQQPNNFFGAAAAPIGNAGAGFLSAIFSGTKSAVDLPGSANLANAVLPPDIRNKIQFVLWDPIRGVRLSDVINLRSITYVNQQPYLPPQNHIVVFNPRYTTVPAIPMPTLQGDTLTVKISITEDFWEYNMNALFASTIVPGGQVGQPATPAQLQQANFQLLENILASDVPKGDNPLNPTGYVFNRILSRTLSAATNYTQIVLVGNVRRQYPMDNYYMPGPIKFDVSLIEGFGPSPVYEDVLTIAGMSAAIAANNSYIGIYLPATPGSGNYEQVLWHERQSVTQEGHFNFIRYATPQRTNPFTAAQPGNYYDCVTIDYKNTIVVTGENTDKNLHKRLTIWYARAAAPLPLFYDVVNVSAAPLLVPLPPQYTLANVFAAAAPNPVFIAGAVFPPLPIAPAANAAASWGPFNRAYVPPVIPAQGANQALFADDFLAGFGPAASFITNLTTGLFN